MALKLEKSTYREDLLINQASAGHVEITVDHKAESAQVAIKLNDREVVKLLGVTREMSLLLAQKFTAAADLIEPPVVVIPEEGV